MQIKRKLLRPGLVNLKLQVLPMPRQRLLDTQREMVLARTCAQAALRALGTQVKFPPAWLERNERAVIRLVLELERRSRSPLVDRTLQRERPKREEFLLAFRARIGPEFKFHQRVIGQRFVRQRRNDTTEKSKT